MRNAQQAEPKLQTVEQPRKEPDQPACRFTTGEWFRTWFELYSKPNLRETTQEQYTNFLEKHLIPNIGEIPLDKLTSLRLQKLYQDLRTIGRVVQNNVECSGLSPKTVRSIHMVLHSALEQAVKEGLIKKNPTDGCNPPKLERKEMKVIQPEQIGAYCQRQPENVIFRRNGMPFIGGQHAVGMQP